MRFLQTWTDWAFSKLGYYPTSPNDLQMIDDLYMALQSRDFELDGLVAGFGSLEQRHKTDTLLVVALLTLAGNEEFTLKWDFLKAIYEKNLTIHTETLENNDISVKVVLNNQEEM